MTPAQITELVSKYFDAEGYSFSPYFEHRFDPDSSAILYSLIRAFQPTVSLEIGSWRGGSTCVITAALQKNGGKFTHIVSEIDDECRAATVENVRQICGVEARAVGDITKHLNNVPKKLDLLFVDTDHDLETTQWIVENIFPRLKKGGMLVFHDWAVTEENGKWMGKGPDGTGGWPETQYLIELHERGEFPFEKIYWTYGNPFPGGTGATWETGFWIKL